LHQHGDSKVADLKIARRDGTLERDLFHHVELHADNLTLAWSPDGKTIVIPIVQPTPQDIGGFLAVDVASASMKQVAIAKDRLYNEPVWLPDMTGLIVSAATMETGFRRRQIGIVSFPDGAFHLLTTDTNDYFHPSLSADGQSIAANQSQAKYQVEIAPVGSLENFKPLKLPSTLPIRSWDLTADAQVLLIQGSDIRMVNPSGGDRVIFSDSKYAVDQVASCGQGRYIVFRSIGRSGGAEANLWRVDSNGTNLLRLTFGVNDRVPVCSYDGKWLYFIDAAENHFLKRIPIDGGTPETIIKSPAEPYDLSPDGKTFATFEARESDHATILITYSVEDGEKSSLEFDPRALPSLVFMPSGRAVLYAVREKGVDNLWVQPLDGSARRQLTHFTSEKIGGYEYSKDGTRLAVGRGHADSDAILLRNIPH